MADKRMEQELLELRKDIFLTGFKGGMAHLASCFSSLEILYALYMEGILKLRRENPHWHDRDRFILSKGLDYAHKLRLAGVPRDEQLSQTLRYLERLEKDGSGR